MTIYCLRIHEDSLGELKLESVLQRLRNTSYCMCYETEGCVRPHFQGWLFSDLKSDQIRYQIKKYTQLHGNEAYSLKVCASHEKFVGDKDTIGYRDYCYKGTRSTLPIIHCKYGLEIHTTPEVVAECHAKYWRLLRSGAGKGPIVRQLMEFAKFSERSHTDLIHECCRMIVEADRPLVPMYVRGVVNSVVWKLNGTARSKMFEYIKSLFPYDET